MTWRLDSNCYIRLAEDRSLSAVLWLDLIDVTARAPLPMLDFEYSTLYYKQSKHQMPTALVYNQNNILSKFWPTDLYNCILSTSSTTHSLLL